MDTFLASDPQRFAAALLKRPRRVRTLAARPGDPQRFAAALLKLHATSQLFDPLRL